jgi:hypothetical protein
VSPLRRVACCTALSGRDGPPHRPCATKRGAGWLLFLAAFVAQAWAQAPGRIEAATEAAVKAAFLYKFASYVEWPPKALGPPDAPFVFGVMGAGEVAAELERIVSGKTIGGHPAVVRRVKEDEALSGMQVLFVGRSHPNPRAIASRATQQPGLLLVTEGERGLELGSAISFVPVDDRVGFEVSLEAAERSGLKVSSRMLNVARRVVQR